MARLFRPHIPIKTRVKVARRQLAQCMGDGFLIAFDATIRAHNHAHPGFIPPGGEQLRLLLVALAEAMRCTPQDFNLDHDPPLAARPRERRGLSPKTFYTPDANDPDYLFYRPHGPEFEGSHLIKTNVRGEHGQHPDRVLIKKAKRLERGPRQKPKRKWASRPFPKGKKAFR